VARREAERSLGRFRAGVWPIVQTALAATLAWSAAALTLGHEQPFVAAIAAVISIGSVAGQTLRRAVEWTLGVAVGLAVADFIMLALGSGPLQTGLMVGLAMSVALLIRGGVMFWTESGVSALLVAGLDPTTSGVSPDRFLEALIGGGMALAVSATFPSNPSVRAKQAARPVLEDLATVLRDSAAALIGGDVKLAEGARSEARRIDAPVARLREELDGGYHIARYAPPRMRHLGRLGYYAVAADQLDLAVRNTRVLARAAVTLVRDKGAAPGGLGSGPGLPLRMRTQASSMEEASLSACSSVSPQTTATARMAEGPLEVLRRLEALAVNAYGGGRVCRAEVGCEMSCGLGSSVERMAPSGTIGRSSASSTSPGLVRSWGDQIERGRLWRSWIGRWGRSRSLPMSGRTCFLRYCQCTSAWSHEVTWMRAWKWVGICPEGEAHSR
jgi:Fusaric acid resistance protein-like